MGLSKLLLFYFRVNIVQWGEDLYEKQLIERTKDACCGLVDIVINFGTTSRSLHRSLQCLNPVSITTLLLCFYLLVGFMSLFWKDVSNRRSFLIVYLV